MKNIELLAPAGNAENLIIAINNGANAVYLGLKGFNARSKAENFTEENIRTYVKLAHLYGVKVYVTVNTLIKDSELNEIIHLVNVAANAKVDAFLVQDLGLLKILKQCFKNINLHASTQMGVHNKYGAIVAQNLGCSRVVLSRESTKQDIIDALKKIYDPEIPVNIWDMGLIYDIDIVPNLVKIKMTFTSPTCPMMEELLEQVRAVAQSIAGDVPVRVDLVWDPPWDLSRMSDAARIDDAE